MTDLLELSEMKAFILQIKKKNMIQKLYFVYGRAYMVGEGENAGRQYVELPTKLQHFNLDQIESFADEKFIVARIMI